MTKKEFENMTVNIIRTAEFYAHYKQVNKEKADALFSQLLGKMSLAASMGVSFTCYDLLLNERDVQQNSLYKTFTPGNYIEVVRGDGFRHLAPVRTSEEACGNE